MPRPNPTFAEDPYIRDRQARSMLCLPLINQGKLNGVLYLENNLAPGVFAPARIAVLKLLASQAAIALENTRLYRDLAEREAKIRRLFDANLSGSASGNSKGQILDANDAYLRTIGYDREDLLSGRLSWMDLTPPEWARPYRTDRSRVKDDRNGAAVREGVFPQGRQPRAIADRLGGLRRKRESRASLSCSI